MEQRSLVVFFLVHHRLATWRLGHLGRSVRSYAKGLGIDGSQVGRCSVLRAARPAWNRKVGVVEGRERKATEERGDLADCRRRRAQFTGQKPIVADVAAGELRAEKVAEFAKTARVGSMGGQDRRSSSNRQEDVEKKRKLPERGMREQDDGRVSPFRRSPRPGQLQSGACQPGL